MEDLTDPETLRLDPKCDRSVCLYGYLRGTYMKNKSLVHIPGEASFEPCAYRGLIMYHGTLSVKGFGYW